MKTVLLQDALATRWEKAKQILYLTQDDEFVSLLLDIIEGHHRKRTNDPLGKKSSKNLKGSFSCSSHNHSSKVTIRISICKSCGDAHVVGTCPLQHPQHELKDSILPPSILSRKLHKIFYQTEDFTVHEEDDTMNSSENKMHSSDKLKYQLQSINNCVDFPMSYAESSLPDRLMLKPGKSGDLAVFAKRMIHKYCKLGPVIGKPISRANVAVDFDLSYLWRIKKNSSFYLDTSNSDYSNWTRFLRPANSRENRNLLTLIQHNCLYFVTTKVIERGRQLLYWVDLDDVKDAKHPFKKSNKLHVEIFHSRLKLHKGETRKHRNCVTEHDIANPDESTGTYEEECSRKLSLDFASLKVEQASKCRIKLKVNHMESFSDSSNEGMYGSALKLNRVVHNSQQRNSKKNMRRKVKKNQFSCTECGQKFKKKSCFGFHMTAHSTMKVSQCENVTISPVITAKHCLKLKIKKIPPIVPNHSSEMVSEEGKRRKKNKCCDSMNGVVSGVSEQLRFDSSRRITRSQQRNCLSRSEALNDIYEFAEEKDVTPNASVSNRIKKLEEKTKALRGILELPHSTTSKIMGNALCTKTIQCAYKKDKIVSERSVLEAEIKSKDTPSKGSSIKSSEQTCYISISHQQSVSVNNENFSHCAYKPRPSLNHYCCDSPLNLSNSNSSSSLLHINKHNLCCAVQPNNAHDTQNTFHDSLEVVRKGENEESLSFYLNKCHKSKDDVLSRFPADPLHNRELVACHQRSASNFCDDAEDVVSPLPGLPEDLTQDITNVDHSLPSAEAAEMPLFSPPSPETQKMIRMDPFRSLPLYNENIFSNSLIAIDSLAAEDSIFVPIFKQQQFEDSALTKYQDAVGGSCLMKENSFSTVNAYRNNPADAYYQHHPDEQRYCNPVYYRPANSADCHESNNFEQRSSEAPQYRMPPASPMIGSHMGICPDFHSFSQSFYPTEAKEGRPFVSVHPPPNNNSYLWVERPEMAASSLTSCSERSVRYAASNESRCCDKEYADCGSQRNRHCCMSRPVNLVCIGNSDNEVPYPIQNGVADGVVKMPGVQSHYY